MILTINNIDTRLRHLEGKETHSSLVVPITSFAPEKLTVLQDIKVVVQEDDNEFIATFFDANISATGCNQVEAIENIKDTIIGRFDFLAQQEETRLGPALLKQLNVLREFVERRS